MRVALSPQLGWLAALVLGILHAPQAGSAEAEPSVLVRTLVVHAEQKPGQVDWICEKLKKKLAPMNFGTLRVVQQRQFKLRFGEQGALSLPEGREVRFLPISVVHRQLHMQIEMPGLVNTRMRMVSGRGVILGGVEHGDGYLIVHVIPSFRMPRSETARSQRPVLHRAKAPAK